MSPLPLYDIPSILAEVFDCPGGSGAVLTTADGLVMACVGDLLGDEAAGCAAGLAIGATEALSGVGSDAPVQQLVWTHDSLWYLAVMPSTHVLLLRGRQAPHAGALVLAGQRMRARLEPAIQAL